MKPKKADILAVAKAAGVSASTVSRSFNHPDLVKATTRRKIDRAIRNLGYIRNRAAQTIHGIRSGTIGLLVPTIDHTIFAEVIQNFADAVEDFGFTILLASHGYDLDREYNLARKMLEHRVDGLACIGLEHSDALFSLIERQGIPAILLWNHSDSAKLPCVGCDNFQTGWLAGQHIVSLGHRDVACVFPPLKGNDRAAQRYLGLCAALSDSGIEIPENWVLETTYSVADSKSAVSRLLQSGQRPTAMVCGNDVLAWGALHAASREGIAVPDQMSVVGIGDFKGSKDFEPPLTTVRIPARQIGRKAAERIAQAVVSPEKPIVSDLIEPELVVRATTIPVLTQRDGAETPP